MEDRVFGGWPAPNSASTAKRAQGTNVENVHMNKEGHAGNPALRCVCTSADHECRHEWSKKHFVCTGCGDETHKCKIEVGVCGCGESEADSDSDGTPDCVDGKLAG